MASEEQEGTNFVKFYQEGKCFQLRRGQRTHLLISGNQRFRHGDVLLTFLMREVPHGGAQIEHERAMPTIIKIEEYGLAVLEARIPYPRVSMAKAFMRYVEYRVPSALEQIGRVHAIPVKRHDQKLIRHLTMEEVRAILNAPDVTTRSGVRDRAMMHLCFAGGLRVSELVGTLTANLSLQHSAAVTIRG